MHGSFSSRWGLPEEDIDEKVAKFVNRLLVIVGNYPKASVDSLKAFAFSAGISIDKYGRKVDFTEPYFDAEGYFINFSEIHELANKLEVFLDSTIVRDSTKKLIVKLTNSSHIGIRIVQEHNSFFAYPEGEPKLDEEIVEKALKSLGIESSKEYTQALTAYAANDWIKTAEKTRRTLEEYLREYLSNNKGLKANIKTLGVYLKENSHTTEPLRVALTTLLSNLDTQYNNASKHASKTDGYIEAEYLIYQTGIVIRTIEQIKLRSDK